MFKKYRHSKRHCSFAVVSRPGGCGSSRGKIGGRRRGGAGGTPRNRILASRKAADSGLVPAPVFTECVKKLTGGRAIDGFHVVVGGGSSMRYTNESGLLFSELVTSEDEMIETIENTRSAALTEQLPESELFGHEEGAFAGAKKGGKPGLFELAHQGTIFLDEIDSTPLTVQLRLLRVIAAAGRDLRLPSSVLPMIRPMMWNTASVRFESTGPLSNIMATAATFPPLSALLRLMKAWSKQSSQSPVSGFFRKTPANSSLPKFP